MVLNQSAKPQVVSDYPEPNQYYKHFKGPLYKVEKIGLDCDTSEPVVVYYCVMQRQTYTRKLSSWLSSKKLDDGTEVKRFTKVR